MWCAFSPWEEYNLQGPSPLKVLSPLWKETTFFPLVQPVSSHMEPRQKEVKTPLQITAAIMEGFHSDPAELKNEDKRTPHPRWICFQAGRGRVYLLHLNPLPTCGSLMCVFNQWRQKVANIWNNIAVESTTMKNSSSKFIVSKLYLSMLEYQFGVVKLRRLQSSSSIKSIAILSTVFQVLGSYKEGQNYSLISKSREVEIWKAAF